MAEAVAVLGIVSGLFEFIVSLNRGKALEAAVAASSLSTTALRLPSLYSEYQEQLRLLLTKLTEHSGYNPTQVRELLHRDEFAGIKEHVLHIERKLAQLAAGVKTDGRHNTVPQLQRRKSGNTNSFDKYFDSDDALVVDAIQSALGSDSLPAPVTHGSKPVRFEWKMKKGEVESILKDVEYALANFKAVVDKLQPALPDFESTTVLALWDLQTGESGTMNELDYITGDHTFVYPASMADWSFSMPERILGQYGRIRIPDQDLCPGGMYRGICKLFMRFQHFDNRTIAIGTGWLIDNDTVITAAHNLYNTIEKSHATHIDVFVGYTSTGFTGPAKWEQRRAETAGIHWGYYATGRHVYDMGVLRLSSPFAAASAIPYKTTPYNLAQNTNLRVVGYPGDLPTTDEKKKGRDMYQSQCPVGAANIADNGYQLKYILDTAGGNSGGPILEVNADGSFHAIGVHCYGGKDMNSGTVIGHKGNDIEYFRAAMRLGDEGTRDRVEYIQGQVAGLQRITFEKAIRFGLS